MIIVCSLRIQYHIRDASRSCRGCLDRFMWLFHHLIWFYDSEHAKTHQNQSWRSKTKCHVCDQIMITVCSLRVQCHVWGVSVPCRRCLDRFMWLFHHLIRFYGSKHAKYVKINHENKRSCLWSNHDYFVFITGSVSHLACF